MLVRLTTQYGFRCFISADDIVSVCGNSLGSSISLSNGKTLQVREDPRDVLKNIIVDQQQPKRTPPGRDKVAFVISRLLISPCGIADYDEAIESFNQLYGCA